MHTRFTGLLLLILSLLLSGLPLAAQEVALLQKAEVMIVRPGEAAPAFACAEEDCERLAWLPAGARVAVISQVEGRELEGSPQWYEVLLDCPCFDYDKIALSDLPFLDPDTDNFAMLHPDFSPAGERIAAVHGSFLYVWDAQSGELLVKEMLDEFPLQHMDMSWSPDGKRILVVGATIDDQIASRNILLLLDADGQSRRSLDLQDGFAMGVAWSNDGTRFLTTGDALRIRDGQQGELLITIDALFTTAAWSPDDTRIITGGYVDQAGDMSLAGELALWESASGDLLEFRDTGCHIASIKWSPDNSRIAWGNIDESCGGLHVFEVTSGNISDSLTDDSLAFTVTWSPDGRFLMANMGYKVQLLDPDDGRVHAILAEPDNGFFPGMADWSPAGDRIAIAGFTSTPPMGNQRGRSTKSYAAWIWDLTLIPDGRTLTFIHSSLLGNAAPGDG